MRLIRIITFCLILFHSGGIVANSDFNDACSTKLFHAIYKNDKNAVGKCIKGGILEHEKLHNYRLAFDLAADESRDYDFDILKVFWDAGIDMNAALYEDGPLPLFTLLYQTKSTDLFDFFVKHGADLSVVSNEKDLLQATLGLAHTLGHHKNKTEYSRKRYLNILHIIERLLSTNIFDKYKKNDAFFFSELNSYPRHDESTRTLFKKYGFGSAASHRRHDKRLRQGRFWSSVYKGNIDDIKGFLEVGFSPNHMDSDGNSAIQVAISRGHSDLALYLLSRADNLSSVVLTHLVDTAIEARALSVKSVLRKMGAVPSFRHCDKCYGIIFSGEGGETLYADANTNTITTYRAPFLDSVKVEKKILKGERVYIKDGLGRVIVPRFVSLAALPEDFYCGAFDRNNFKKEYILEIGKQYEYVGYSSEGYSYIRSDDFECDVMDLNSFVIGDLIEPQVDRWVYLIRENGDEIGWFFLNEYDGAIRFGDREF